VSNTGPPLRLGIACNIEDTATVLRADLLQMGLRFLIG
jgi:hypothetical protein